MMNPKAWHLTGEATAKDRPANSLLEVHLDFNTATRLPPTITKETTDNIEALIKQRVLDELFDDPILRKGGKRKIANDFEINFTKNKKGLGEQYQDDLQKKLLAMNSDAFLENELKGPDAAIKREIEDISKELFLKLDTLSNFHFTPRAPKTEASIST
jgi:U3 small nucleolar RNA-associated protein MPP10